jgi:AraC-like DNA-binding protein
MLTRVSGITVSSSLPLLVLELARAHGLDASAVARETGLDRPEIREPDARIPIEIENQVWDLVARRLGDPAFGLHAGLLYRPGQLEAFDYVCFNAPTVRESLRAVVRYNRLLHDVAEFSLEERGASAFVRHGFRAGVPGPSWQAVDFVAGSAVAFMEAALGRPVTFRSVGIAHAAPEDPKHYQERLHASKVLFDQETTWIEFDARWLDERVPQANPGLFKVLSRHAESLLSQLPAVDSFQSRFREVIAAELKQGAPALGTVAARLHMSARTLQRRLAEENLSFKDEVEELRRGLAMRYVGDSHLSLGEVAFLLGYSEARAFHRAFKAWTGETPGEMRRRLAG